MEPVLDPGWDYACGWTGIDKQQSGGLGHRWPLREKEHLVESKEDPSHAIDLEERASVDGEPRAH
jgi:hypothetical protein